MTRSKLACALALFVLSLGGGTAAQSAQRPLLGVQADRGKPVTLRRLDGATLRAVGAGVPLRGHGQAWSFSPDGSQLVLGSRGVATLGSPLTRASPPSLRFVDVRRMRVLRDVKLRGEAGFLHATAWLARNRLVVLLNDTRTARARLLLVDPAAGTVLRRRSLERGRMVMGGERTADELLLLLAPGRQIGAAKLVAVDRELRLRAAVLDRIRAGSAQRGSGEDFVLARREPGLAVDAAGERAYVVGADEPVASVDLRRLGVTYLEASAERQPQLRQKSLEGPEREAVWLPNGLLAVSGETYAGLAERRLVSEPAGLQLVDTQTGQARLLDPQARSVLRLGRRLVTAGADRGIVGYDLGGTRRYTALEDRKIVWLQAAGTRLVAQSDVGTVAVLDAVSGRVLAERRGPVAQLVSGSAARIW